MPLVKVMIENYRIALLHEGLLRISFKISWFFVGLITYGTQPSLAFSSCFVSLQNRLCTVADSMRVADDLGKHKMAFKILNKPVFGMKGSYVVTKVNRVEWIFQTISTQAF